MKDKFICTAEIIAKRDRGRLEYVIRRDDDQSFDILDAAYVKGDHVGTKGKLVFRSTTHFGLYFFLKDE